MTKDVLIRKEHKCIKYTCNKKPFLSLYKVNSIMLTALQ